MKRRGWYVDCYRRSTMSRVVCALASVGIIAGWTNCTERSESIAPSNNPVHVAIPPVAPIPHLEATSPKEIVAKPATIHRAAPQPAIESLESAEPIGPIAAIESSEAIEPIEPIEPRAALDPLDPLDPLESIESSDELPRRSITALMRRYGGVMFDVGVPDGATAAFVVRPVRAVRLDAGISYNGISHGVRGGVTLIPFATWLSPTFSFDVGHYADGDANPLVRLVTGNPMFSSPVLDRVGYDYADAHVGLELGRKTFTFYVHAGASVVTGSVHDLGELDNNMPKTKVTFGADPTITLTTVSARLGFIYYFGK